MNIRKAVKTLGLCMALAGLAATAKASSSDTVTVTITPNASYAVSITTTGAVLNLGTVGLAASTQTVSPATVTVNSTYAYTGLTLSAGITTTGSNTAWSFASNTGSQTTDKLAAWAVFTDTSVQTTPSKGSGNYFTGTTPGGASDVVQASGLAVGTTGASSCPTPGTGGKSYIAASGASGYKTMECLPANAIDSAGSLSFLWLYFTLPPATTSSSAQSISFTVNAGAPQ